MARFIAAVLLVSVAFLGLVRTAQAQTPSPQPVATQLPCPTGLSVNVTPPDAAAPTTVNVTLTPAQPLKAASFADPNSLHVHYFIDVLPTPAGTVIPSNDPKIIHSGALTQDLGPLSAGMHTVTVVVGQLNHTACDARGSSTFIVGQVAAQVAPPKSGNAGLASSSSSALVVVLLVGVTAAVVVAARYWSPRNK
jgi:hypothetical protein